MNYSTKNRTIFIEINSFLSYNDNIPLIKIKKDTLKMENNSIGRKINYIRRTCNMSQLDLAKILCISHQQVSKWERDENLPDIITLSKIAEIFNIDIKDLTDTNLSCTSLQLTNTFDQNSTLKQNDITQNLESINPSSNITYNCEPNHIKENPTLLNNSDNFDAEFALKSQKIFKFTCLQNIDFYDKNFIEHNFSYSKVNKTYFNNSKLTNCPFNYSTIDNCNIKDCFMENTQVKCSTLKNTTFSDSTLIDFDIPKSTMHTINFNNCNINKILSNYSKIIGTSFNNNNIKNWEVFYSQFNKIDFIKNNISQLIIKHSKIKNCSFADTTLTTCIFSNSKISNLTFTNCTLIDCTFIYTKLKDTTFTNCKTDKFTLSQLKYMPHLDISGITLIE